MNEVQIQWMWVLYKNTLITAYHVVRNQNLTYYVDRDSYILRHADTRRDRAFLTKADTPYNWEIEKIFEWSRDSSNSITAQVIRNNQVAILTGNILDRSGSILGYNQSGYIVPITGVIITDIWFVSGESGSPIFDSRGQLIDVVHVQ